MSRSRKKREEKHPELKAALLEAVENQIRANEPPETRQTLERLVREGIPEQVAREYIATVLVAEMHAILTSQQPFNLERYARNLARLPEEPVEE